MKAKPILFQSDMIRAILDGRKTQTRRIVKKKTNPHEFLGGFGEDRNDPYNWGFEHPDFPGDFIYLPDQCCPYGQTGDLLWVRENFAKCKDGAVYAADCVTNEKGWKPSIHMPRWASRITLEITDIRVERLQDMEGAHPYESDALAEGINTIYHGDGAYYYSAFQDYPHPKNWCDPTDAFKELWQSIYGPNSWQDNPWVWVLEFKPHLINVDDYKRKNDAID